MANDNHLLSVTCYNVTNSIIEIDNCSPLELLKLQARLKEISE